VSRTQDKINLGAIRLRLLVEMVMVCWDRVWQILVDRPGTALERWLESRSAVTANTEYDGVLQSWSSRSGATRARTGPDELHPLRRRVS
jgi:hypothetical protein